MLKFYTNIQELTSENRRRVFPLLFDWFYISDPVAKQNFKSVSTLEEADVCILPIDVGVYFTENKEQELKAFISNALTLNKKVWVYSAGDFGITLLEDVITFRLGGFHSKMNSNNLVIPSFVGDPYLNVLKKSWQPIDKQALPTVGFVGNADGSNIKWSKELLIYMYQSWKRVIKKDPSDWQFFYPSGYIRFKLLEKIRKSSLIDASFIYRNKYRAGVNLEFEKKNTTLEFYQNIEQNLYTFCLRGGGNFSVRFYETLIMGRIPLLIDTDVRLPLSEQIDWKAQVVLATSSNYCEALLDFHEKHTSEQLREIQIKNRNLALSNLNRVDYFITIANLMLNNKL